MYVEGVGSTVDLAGCSFSENSDTNGGYDIHTNWGTINIDGCPAGFYGTAGAALDTYNGNYCAYGDYYCGNNYYDYYYDDDERYDYENVDGGTITGEEKSYSCDACVR